MKKTVALILTLVMILLSMSALAETSAEILADAAESLLFETENVTLSAEAEFSLDGSRFKTANGTYIRDREDSFWQLKLFTPRADGPENSKDRESGFTIIANSEMVYVMETLLPGLYKTATVFPRTTVLRRSVQVDLMAKLARDLAKQADTLVGEGAIAETKNEQGGTEYHIVLDENVPDLVNTALTMAFQTVAGRYFNVNYDQLNNRFMGAVSAYYTVTSGILYTTEYIYLKQADVTVVLNAADELQSVSGVFSAYLQTGGDGEHLLDISFRLDASDRGGSKVDRFDPDRYGVVPANEFSQPDEMPEAEEPQEAPEETDFPAAVSGKV